MSLGRDLARAWDSPGATAETKKKIIRLLIAEIVVDISDTLKLIIQWQGDHTELTVKKNKVGHNRWVTDADVVNCRIWYSISRTVSDDDAHRGGMMIARSALSPSSPAPAARRKSGVGA
ncbi:MAG TPA: hypothetical protein VH678_22410 [Xanthobacteraceae bacterium]|jgi:hypothetical protein